MKNNIPPIPVNSFRVVITLDHAEKRLDNILLKALRDQDENFNLKHISRSALKKLFTSGKIVIKGQKATPSSALAKGVTYVDIILPKPKTKTV